VAVYVPAASPVSGATVKLCVAPVARLGIDVLLSVKLLAFAPDNATKSAPVGWLPVFATVTLWGVNAPYPTLAAGNVWLPDGVRLMQNMGPGSP
jgi:hypothetical protein